MVGNVNNYGGGTNLSPLPSYNNNNQPQNNNFVENNNYSRNDSYAFNLSNVPSGKVPDVEVGLLDKVTSYFKDVNQSPENLKMFKVFENSIKANPGGFLQPGSTDTGKVKDLQKKLSFVGVSVNQNGEFGPATEQAVIKFKKSQGINDGFLDKNGNFAVTAIVTPQTWNVLNGRVNYKLNPNAQISGNGYTPPPISREELDWAKTLQQKISQLGYKPSPDERQKYDNIYQRQQINVSSQSGSYNSSPVPPPSQDEIDWAKVLVNKIQQYGYKPKNDEIQKYKDISQRQKQSKIVPPQQNIPNTNMGNNSPGGVSPAELSWATELMNKVKAGYRPSPDEEIKYQDIFSRSQAQQGGNTNQQQGVSPAEMQWAQQLESRVNGQGYNPTADERAKYDDIFRRSQNQVSGQPNNAGGVTQQELNWAQQLENRVNTQGYNPTTQERAQYEDIYKRYQSGGLNSGQPSQQAGPVQRPTDQEVAWAMELERKTKQENYQPNQNELAIYNDIATKLENYNKAQQNGTTGTGTGNATADELAWASSMFNKMQNGYKPTPTEMTILTNIQNKAFGNNNNNPVQNNGPVTMPKPKPVQQPAEEQPETIPEPAPTYNTATEFVYSQANINAFKEAFPGVEFLGGDVPYLPPALGKQVANENGFSTVSQLQQAVKCDKIDGKFGPETYFRLNQYLNGGQQSGNSGGVTQQELDWATSFQQKVQGGYKPSQQELDKYTDIFNRYQANGNQVTDNKPKPKPVETGESDTGVPIRTGPPPTEEELQWAADLQAKLTKNYSPTQEEIDKYTDIYNRHQASIGGAPSLNSSPGQKPTTDPGATTNPGNVTVNAGSGDAEVQWALQLLERVQTQGYTPTDQELQKYEQIIARNQTVPGTP